MTYTSKTANLSLAELKEAVNATVSEKGQFDLSFSTDFVSGLVQRLRKCGVSEVVMNNKMRKLDDISVDVDAAERHGLIGDIFAFNGVTVLALVDAIQ